MHIHTFIPKHTNTQAAAAEAVVYIYILLPMWLVDRCQRGLHTWLHHKPNRKDTICINSHISINYTLIQDLHIHTYTHTQADRECKTSIWGMKEEVEEEERKETAPPS
jgi:hypothetical protein